MANHGPSYGLDADIKAKQDSKLDVNLETQAREYITGWTGITINNLHEDLKSGIVLCNLGNKISSAYSLGPLISGVGTAKAPFVMMENINKFLVACEKLGLKKKIELFQTVDLYEAKNLVPVVDTLVALKRKFPVK